MTDHGTALHTIGDLARASGLTVRTIRYWSDEGVLPPTDRTPGGYRLYDDTAAARLELIRTLRELGLGLDAVREVLAGERTVAEVAAAHVAALDAQIGSLKVTRAVLSSVARRGSTAKELTLMHRLAKLSAAERQRIMREFTEETLRGLTGLDPEIRDRISRFSVELPDDPTPEQVDAWVELAELLQDPEFRAQMRRAAEYNAAGQLPAGGSMWFVKRLVERVGPLRERGVEPGSAEAEEALRELFGDQDRAAALERMSAAFDERLARYRELLSVVNGRPAPPHAEDFGWVVAALRLSAGG